MTAAQIDSTMEELFHLEAGERLRTLSAAILSIEQNPAKETWQQMMREAHSLKGAFGMMQAHDWVNVAHVLEDIFQVYTQLAQAPLQTAIDCILHALDTFQSVSTLPLAELLATENNIYAAKARAIEHELRTLLASLRVPSSSDVPALAATLIENSKATTALEAPATSDCAERSGSTWVRNETLRTLAGLGGENLVLAKSLPIIAQELQHELKQILRQSSESSVPHSMVVDSRLQRVQELLGQLEDQTARTLRVSSQLYHEVISCKLRPFSDLGSSLTRLVRDLSRSLGKDCKLELQGGDTLVDRDILQQLDLQLAHLVRNALDHGIETEAERSTVGKNPQGVLSISCGHRNGRLLIGVRDDGRGVSRQLLEDAIVSKNLSTRELVAQMSDQELSSFLFLPGFSTRSEVSAISGRGVGLDAVQNMLQQLGGSIRVTSTPSFGMYFELDLPISLSMVRALVLRVSEALFAVPLAQLVATIKVAANDIQSVEGSPTLIWQNRAVSLSYASELLGLRHQSQQTPTISVVLLEEGGHLYGLVVDQFISHQELTIQNLEHYLGESYAYTTAALNEQGQVIVILDGSELARSMSRQRVSLAEPPAAIEQTTASAEPKRILVVDDSLTVRELERKLLLTEGYEVQIAMDGLEAWSLLKNTSFTLVVSDVDMPRMNGFELVQRIKSSQLHQKTPVIIVSYKERDEDRKRGLEVGADYYLTKSSFHDASFIKAVRSLIGEAA
jgi:two-component system sensor histidine kinase and response regulator WspE